MTLTREYINSISIAEVVAGRYDVYEGDLRHYFKVVFNHARNLGNPYHNMRHMLHVMWLCHTAILFYIDSCAITRRQARNLLIAALFHDYDHSGKPGHDDLEITRALRGLEKHILDSDRPWMDEIRQYVIGTEFPHRTPSSDLTLCGQILRDSDMSQALTSAWIQQIIFGLSQELSMTPIAVLKMQEPFLLSLKFGTDWARDRFGPTVIEDKIREAKELLALLE